MRFFYLIITVFYFNILIGQNNEKIFYGKWEVGSIKNFSGNNILRIEGENNSKSITNIDFKTLSQSKSDIEKKSQTEMWDSIKTAELLYFYEKNAFITVDLYVARRTIGSANFKFFTIVFKDSSEKEVYREDLKEEIPNVPNSGSEKWWNYTQIFLPHEIKGKNYIYIIDQIQSIRYKFEININ